MSERTLRRVLMAVAGAGGGAMLAALIYGFRFGGGWDEVGALMERPWFVVSLVDVYVGFALFACWIALREKPWMAALWIIALMVLGNIIACVYAIVAVAGRRPLFSRPGE